MASELFWVRMKPSVQWIQHTQRQVQGAGKRFAERMSDGHSVKRKSLLWFPYET